MRQKNTSNKVLGNLKLSMSEHLKEIAKRQAEIYFQGNISAYISYLILNDYKENPAEEITNDGTLNNISNSTVNLKNSKIKSKTKK